jgi:alkylated DNA repair dioxygenase AlkB
MNKRKLEQVLKSTSMTNNMENPLQQLKGILSTEVADRLLEELSNDKFYKPRSDFAWNLYGKMVTPPRDQVVFGSGQYKYGRVKLEGQSTPTIVETLLQKINILLNANYHFILCNRYINGADSVAWHSDDELIICPDKAIVSVSLGASRKFAIRPRGSTKTAYSRTLSHGDVIVMPPGMQQKWEHCIPKTKKVKGVRINLTLRETRL